MTNGSQRKKETVKDKLTHTQTHTHTHINSVKSFITISNLKI